MVLKVLVHEAEEGGFWAEVPALPGCVTQAETLADLTIRARESIEAYLGLDDEEPIPAGFPCSRWPSEGCDGQGVLSRHRAARLDSVEG